MRQLLLFAFFLSSAMGVAGNVVEGGGDVEEAAVLVELLGSPRFSERKKAMNRLLHIGPAAIGPLERAARSTNREVRYRSLRLLESVRELEFERQLQAFIQSSLDPSTSLPGWHTFRKRYGDEGDARQLFVAMQRAEPEIMRGVDGDPVSVARLIDRRVQSLQQARRFQGSTITLGTILSLIFAGQDADVQLSDPSIKIIFGLCGYQAFLGEMHRPGSNNRRYLVHDARSDLLRNIYADWMVRPGAYHHYQGFLLALNYDIPGSTRAAEAAIQKKDASPFVKQYALQVLAEYGTRDNIEAVSTLLADHTFCAAAQRVNNRQYRTQIRDVALVCLLAIEKLDPRQHGFPRFAIRTRVVQLSSIGFENDEEREKAHSGWQAYIEAKK